MEARPLGLDDIAGPALGQLPIEAVREILVGSGVLDTDRDDEEVAVQASPEYECIASDS